MSNRDRQTYDRDQELVELNSHWRQVFNQYDVNGDGQISFAELNTAIQNDSNINRIPPETIKKLMKKSDEDGNGLLDYDEFVKMIINPENQTIFGHLNKYMYNYLSLARPRRPKPTPGGRVSEADYKGEYEEEYSCCPPALGMVIISIIEIALFAYDAGQGHIMATGPVATELLYNPYKREEAWRYVTYMFVHVGYAHIIVNLIVQVMLGIPLEMVHKSWRVWLVYLAGVLAGSLGTSITSPRVYLAGASGGVYGLIAAHIATIIMNWKEMRYAIYQTLVFAVLCSVDIGTAIYNHYYLQLEDKVGYSAHLFGAVAGLLVSILVLRNLDVLKWERVLWWASLTVYIALMLTGIIWNAAFPSYFPPY